MMNVPVPPMLASVGQPFDSDAYRFEVKWDGVRALAAVTAGHWQLWGRQCVDYTSRYPELEVLRRLPAGTVVDGEVVVLRQGIPDLAALLRRHPLVQSAPIRHAARLLPVHYVLFDLLALRGRCLHGEPLSCRHAALAELLAGHAEPVLTLSAGVIGAGREFFQRVVAQGHEGVVAKQLASRYCPGQRSIAWRKLKPVHVLPCVIVGYDMGPQGVRRLLVAAASEGELRYAATLTSGLGGREAIALARQLALLRRSAPIIACPRAAVWVEPAAVCRVRCRRQTTDGRLQGAVFGGLLNSGQA